MPTCILTFWSRLIFFRLIPVSAHRCFISWTGIHVYIYGFHDNGRCDYYVNFSKCCPIVFPPLSPNILYFNKVYLFFQRMREGLAKALPLPRCQVKGSLNIITNERLGCIKYSFDRKTLKTSYALCAKHTSHGRRYNAATLIFWSMLRSRGF